MLYTAAQGFIYQSAKICYHAIYAIHYFARAASATANSNILAADDSGILRRVLYAFRQKASCVLFKCLPPHTQYNTMPVMALPYQEMFLSTLKTLQHY